jgi:hypothetical protein
MTHLSPFSIAALGWQSFYLLAGTAAATLVGLMFVAVTFGSSMVTDESSPMARAFLDPTLLHFAQILLVSCLATVPTMGAKLFGVLLVSISVLRIAHTFRVYRHTRHAQLLKHDVELSDWLSGVVFPLICYVLLCLTGCAFCAHYALAFDVLAFITLAILLIGLYGAWELTVWMAIVRSRTKE